MNVKKLKETLNEEHNGFAITFEVLCTLFMIFTMFFLILFVLMVMNGQRFMNTVLTTTAAEAARWGGVDSRAYSVNVGGAKLLTEAQNQLNNVVNNGSPSNLSGFRATIGGSPAYIQSDGDQITVYIRYHLPSPWHAIGVVQSAGGNGREVNTHQQSTDLYNKIENSGGLGMTIRVNSIMKSGRLLH